MILYTVLLDLCHSSLGRRHVRVLVGGMKSLVLVCFKSFAWLTAPRNSYVREETLLHSCMIV